MGDLSKDASKGPPAFLPGVVEQPLALARTAGPATPKLGRGAPPRQSVAGRGRGGEWEPAANLGRARPYGPMARSHLLAGWGR
eukprot:2812216-Pyramimonas_sp.AAC.1